MPLTLNQLKAKMRQNPEKFREDQQKLMDFSKTLYKGALQNERIAARPLSMWFGIVKAAKAPRLWKTLQSRRTLTDVGSFSQRQVWKLFCFIAYAESKTDRCVFSLPACRFFQSFFRLKPIPSKNNSVLTFRLPLVRKRRNPKSFLSRPKAPST